jgi:hypothetical protein
MSVEQAVWMARSCEFIFLRPLAAHAIKSERVWAAHPAWMRLTGSVSGGYIVPFLIALLTVAVTANYLAYTLPLAILK